MPRSGTPAPRPNAPRPWPRLTEDLPGPRHPEQCQSCGAAENLTRWREHGHHDEPLSVAVVLCRGCSERLIEPHPRLYSELQEHRPFPGTMPICVDCVHRVGVRCGHPEGELAGGMGPRLTFPKPSRMFVDTSGPGGRRGFSILTYPGPVTKCDGKETADAA